MKVSRTDQTRIIEFCKIKSQQPADSKWQEFTTELFQEKSTASSTLNWQDVQARLALSKELHLLEKFPASEVVNEKRLIQALLNCICSQKSIEELETLQTKLSGLEIDHALAELLGEQLTLIINIEKYGRKAAQLIHKQVFLIKHQEQFLCSVEIPSLSPIDCRLIPKLGIESLWQKFCAAQGEEKRFLTKEAKAALKEIRGQLDRQLTDPVSTLVLCTDPEISKFIQKHAKNRLSVRSSSEEDSEECDNAGGNDTVSNVSAAWEHVLPAVRKDILSLFDEKSLEQRLLAGSQIDIFPTTSCFLQVMVGDHDRPGRFYSGVGFQEEPIGQTDKTSILQVAPGHGEYVVNSKGPVDDYYVSCAEQIHPVIREKPFRKVPGDEGNLKLVENSPALSRSSSLTDDQVITLHRLLRALREEQQGPVDIEFVVDKWENKIYLVQVRPVVYEQLERKPAYLVLKEEMSKKHLTQAGMILSGRKRPEKVASQEVVIAQSLPKAYEKFRAIQDKASIKAIFVALRGTSTSHEGTQFRRRHLPVFYLPAPGYAKTEALLNKKQSLWIDPVQGLIISGVQKELEVQEGLPFSPIPAERSLRAYSEKDQSTLLAILPVSARFSELQPMHRLLEQLKNSSDQQQGELIVEQLLKTLQFYFSYAYQKAQSSSQTQLIRALAIDLFQQAVHLKSQLSTAPRSQERLFPLRFLEAQVYQTTSAGLVDAESIKTVAEEQRSEKIIRTAYPTPELSEEQLLYYFQYMKLTKLALTKKVEKDWHQLVSEILKNPESNHNQTLALLCKEWAGMELGIAWLQSCFSNAWKNSREDALACLSKLHEGYQKQKASLKLLQNLSKEIGDFEQHLSDWEEPDQFLTLFEKVLPPFQASCRELLEFLKAKKYCKSEEERLVSLYAFNQLQQVVELFDQTIKAVTGAPDDKYPDVSLKVTRFGLLMQHYIALLKELALAVPLQVVECIHGKSGKDNGPLIERVKWIEENLTRLQSNPEPYQLETTPLFDVQKLRFPALASLRNKPRVPYQIYPYETIEEVFTSVHGHLKDLVRDWKEVLTQNYLGQELEIAEKFPALQAIHGLFEQSCTNGFGCFLLQGNMLIYKRTLPGEAHEGCLSLATDLRDGSSTLSFKMVGDSGHGRGGWNRWQNVLFYALLGNLILGFSCEEEPYNRVFGGGFQEVVFTWKFPIAQITSPDRVKESYLVNIISLMVAATMPDRVKSHRQFEKISFEANNSLAQIIQNLDTMTSGTLKTYLHQLSDDFYLHYSFFNLQFISFYTAERPELALHLYELEKQRIEVKKWPELTKVLLPLLVHPLEEIQESAYEHLIILLNDPLFLAEAYDVAGELTNSLLDHPKYRESGEELLKQFVSNTVANFSTQRELMPVAAAFLAALQKKEASYLSIVDRYLEQLELSQFIEFALLLFLTKTDHTEFEKALIPQMMREPLSLENSKVGYMGKQKILEKLSNLWFEQFTTYTPEASATFWETLYQGLGSSQLKSKTDAFVRHLIQLQHMDALQIVLKKLDYNLKIKYLEDILALNPQLAAQLLICVFELRNLFNWGGPILNKLPLDCLPIILNSAKESSSIDGLEAEQWLCFFSERDDLTSCLSILKAGLFHYKALYENLNDVYSSFAEAEFLPAHFELIGQVIQKGMSKENELNDIQLELISKILEHATRLDCLSKILPLVSETSNEKVKEHFGRFSSNDEEKIHKSVIVN